MISSVPDLVQLALMLQFARKRLSMASCALDDVVALARCSSTDRIVVFRWSPTFPACRTGPAGGSAGSQSCGSAFGGPKSIVVARGFTWKAGPTMSHSFDYCWSNTSRYCCHASHGRRQAGPRRTAFSAVPAIWPTNSSTAIDSRHQQVLSTYMCASASQKPQPSLWLWQLHNRSISRVRCSVTSKQTRTIVLTLALAASSGGSSSLLGLGPADGQPGRLLRSLRSPIATANFFTTRSCSRARPPRKGLGPFPADLQS